MASTNVSLNFGDVLTTTVQYWHKSGKINDQIFNGLPFFRYLKGRKKTVSGGERIYVPVMYAKNATAASYRMYDALNMTPGETHTIATYDWKQYAVGVFIAGLEMRANKGSDTQIMDLLEARMSNGLTSLEDDLNTDFWSTGGGNNAKNVLSIQEIVSSTPTTGTVGGINRANETWWRNKQRTGGSFEAQGISDMRALRVATSNNVPSGMPTVWFTTPDIYNMYEAALEPRERFTRSGPSGGGKDGGDAGFGKLTFHGAPVEWDDAAPSGNLYALNTNHLQLIVHSDADFKPTDRVRQADQDAWSTHILVQLELTCSAPRFQGVITSITA